ncbi:MULTISPECIES: hypothetical protein [unclassified Nocardioides]|uniref:hypothetical protein n=1 Tax=unclassified Nocardioides TaxID=2615069 RepID=UPI0009F0C01A|nr:MULTISPECIES: hypothetical protein [unclassified Nocardioides]GAW51575.1 hypothetical protein PD653B2_3918 [Nocardioides sp. PD653-B2]GAW54884.1 hypothetical protein PD653_2299 [Nocardioides sp. PD653]
MNTLHDLRTTLGREAAGFDDTERHGRAAAVHQRVRVARRRRATAAAAAAAVVLVAAVATGGVLLGGSGLVEPAGPVTDVAVPEQVEVNGFPYELDEVRQVAPGEDVSVGTGEDVAVMLLATGLGDGSATLSTGDVALARVLAGQERSAPVTGPHGLAYVSGDLDDAPDGAQIGVAVYRPTDELANGFSYDTVVFPSDIGDRKVLNAAFIQGGESSASVVIRGRLDDFAFADYCSTTQPDLTINVEVDGEFFGSTQCQEFMTASRNAASGGWSQPAGGPGRHVVRAYLTRGDGGGEVALEPGTLAGIGAYRWTARRDVIGQPVPETVEWGGRRWMLEDVVDQAAPGQPVETTVDTDSGDRLLGYVTRGGVDVWWNGGLVGRARDSFPATGSTTYDRLAGVLLAGDSYEVTATPTDANGRAALLIYRPV